MNLIVPLLGLLLVVGGFFGGYALGGQKQYKKGHDAGFAEAKAKVDSSISFGASATPIYSISGQVTAIGDGSLDIDAPQMTRNPLDEPTPTSRKVTVSADTKIIMQTERPREEVQKEQDAFAAAMKKFQEEAAAGKQQGTPPIPPAPMTEKTIALSQVKVGQTVFVTSASDIFRAATFAATEIRVSEQPVPPVGAGPAEATAPQTAPLLTPPPSR